MSWRKLPLPAADWLPPADNPLPYGGLLSSLPEEHDYECEIDGQLPDINGTLYRVGPGRYDRGPDRKRMMLDGDGMVQQLSIRNGRAHFRNRYVRTPKYVAEEQANRFLYRDFTEWVDGHLHIGQINIRIVRLHTYFDVVVDDALDGHEDFHLLLLTDPEYERGKTGLKAGGPPFRGAP